jgi:hypothetical protein
MTPPKSPKTTCASSSSALLLLTGEVSGTIALARAPLLVYSVMTFRSARSCSAAS